MMKAIKKRKKCFARMKIIRTFASLLRETRALSSAGSERLPYKQRVGGSNPSAPTTYINLFLHQPRKCFKGRLAQLVQSIWFTPRGSGVRIPQRPQKRSLTKKFVRLFLFLTAFCLTLPYDRMLNRKKVTLYKYR